MLNISAYFTTPIFLHAMLVKTFATFNFSHLYFFTEETNSLFTFSYKFTFLNSLDRSIILNQLKQSLSDKSKLDEEYMQISVYKPCIVSCTHWQFDTFYHPVQWHSLQNSPLQFPYIASHSKIDQLWHLSKYVTMNKFIGSLQLAMAVSHRLQFPCQNVQNCWFKHCVIIFYIKIVLFYKHYSLQFHPIQIAQISQQFTRVTRWSDFFFFFFAIDGIKCNLFVFIFWMHSVSLECILTDQRVRLDHNSLFILHKLTCTQFPLIDTRT